MKHAVIVGHPDANSFTMTVAGAYAQVARSLDHDCIVRDLYRMNFDPRLKESELPGRPDAKPGEDVEAERKALEDVDVFAFIYPLWFNAPPAIVKGYVDRVFGLGFGYRVFRDGGQEPLLRGRHLVHLSSSGSRMAWLNEQGAWDSILSLFDDYFAQICGMTAHPRIHFDSITPGLEARWVNENLKVVEDKVTQYFSAF
jgi:NAD(P)H dehydrogenase (quinone)